MRNNGKCVLMFSGGRDSTIAALRLADEGHDLILATITSNHLVGIENVVQRLAQLKSCLPSNTEWIQIVQPALPSLESLTHTSCLPCQRAYAGVGALLALRNKANDVALGYTKYQSTWPEQTPQATKRLAQVLGQFGLRLQLPVYDLSSKAEADEQLVKYGLPTGSSEQKCLKQESNVEIPLMELEKELERWERSLIEFIGSAEPVALSITRRQKLGEVETV